MFQYEIPPNFMEMIVIQIFIFLAFTKDKKFMKKSGLPNDLISPFLSNYPTI